MRYKKKKKNLNVSYVYVFEVLQINTSFINGVNANNSTMCAHRFLILLLYA